MTQATPGEWETINQASGSSHAIPESLHIRSEESAVFSVLAFIEATPQKFSFEIYLHLSLTITTQYIIIQRSRKSLEYIQVKQESKVRMV